VLGGVAAWSLDPVDQHLPEHLGGIVRGVAYRACRGILTGTPLQGFRQLCYGEAIGRRTESDNCVGNETGADFIEVNARQSPGATYRWFGEILERGGGQKAGMSGLYGIEKEAAQHVVHARE